MTCYLFIISAMIIFIIAKNKNNIMLRWAIRKNHIKIFIQPIVDAHDKSIVGGEILLRWIDDKKRSTPPEKFIAMAEKNNLLLDLTELSLLKLANQLMAKKTNRKFIFFVNINASQIKNKRLIDICECFMKKINTSMTTLVLELTEHEFIFIDDNVKKNLYAIRNMGIKIALDDFGSKNSNLIYLLEFIPDYIKIDKSFIQSLNNIEAAKYIIEELEVLSKKLSIKTIAEGVECKEQLTELNRIGVDYIQGYFFGKANYYKSFFKGLHSE
ncbi:EAL domain-containing protein [Escherichia coli]|uniref:EAL domain-containing protein n=1 Tax=Escherichia coli TaxID=562 RepID=UPI0038B58E82